MSIGVGIFAKYGMENTAADDWGAIGNGYKGTQSVLELKLILGSTTMTWSKAFHLWPWGRIPQYRVG